jgi:hypothetical protein
MRKSIGIMSLLITITSISHATEKCGKVEQLYFKAYPDKPQYSGISIGISGNNGNSHSIPDSAVPLATAAKIHGLVICYSVKLDEEGKVYVSDLRIK